MKSQNYKLNQYKINSSFFDLIQNSLLINFIKFFIKERYLDSNTLHSPYPTFCNLDSTP